MHSTRLKILIFFFFYFSAGAAVKTNGLCNSCVVNCKDHSGTAPAARAQSRLLDTIPTSFPLRNQRQLWSWTSGGRAACQEPSYPVCLLFDSFSPEDAQFTYCKFTQSYLYFFFPPKVLVLRKCPQALEGPHIEEASQNPFIVYIPAYTRPSVSQKCAEINTCRPALIFWHSSLKQHFGNNPCGVLSLCHI